MRFGFLSLALVAALVLSSGLASATNILNIDRFVRVSTTVNAAGFAGDDRADIIQSDAPGLFDESVVDGVGIGDIVQATGEATQESIISSLANGLTIEAGGATGVVVDANDLGEPSFARATAESSLSITFAVEAPSPYALSFSLLADLAELNVFSISADTNSDVFARALLTAGGGETVFDTLAFDPSADDQPETGELTLDGLLLPGVYRLDISSTAFLKATEDASGFATSGYGLSLIIVPEPGTFLLAGLGLIGLALYARRPAIAVGGAASTR